MKNEKVINFICSTCNFKTVEEIKNNKVYATPRCITCDKYMKPVEK